MKIITILAASSLMISIINICIYYACDLIINLFIKEKNIFKKTLLSTAILSTAISIISLSILLFIYVFHFIF